MSVYFIRAGSVVKIGYSADPHKRLADLQTANHRKLTLVATIPGEREDESRLHGRFAAYRIAGEWFTYSRPIRALVRSVRGLDHGPETDRVLWMEDPAIREAALRREAAAQEAAQEAAAAARRRELVAQGDLLHRLREVWPEGQERALLADLAAALADRWADHAGWQAADLGRALRTAGIEPSKGVRAGTRTTGTGIYARDLAPGLAAPLPIGGRDRRAVLDWVDSLAAV